MLDIKFIRENIEAVKDSCKKRGVKCDIDKLLKIDKERRELIVLVEGIAAKKNKASKEIANSENKKKIISEMQKIDKKGDKLTAELKKVEDEFNKLMAQVPNIIFPGVPTGKNDTENIILKKNGEPTKFDFQAKDYLKIAKNLDLIDVKRAAKVSGSRFGYLKNQAALLEIALTNLAIDVLTKKGFSLVIPPVMIRPKMMKAMGYTERGGDEIYYLKDDDLCLVGTSEQSLGPMHLGEILNVPKRYLGFSTCFRREAGSYGKDTKGILRVHQFNKLEMFSFVEPKNSEKEHKFLLSLQEELMKALKLPYQVVNVCSGDLGDPAAAKYDIETWIPSEKKYRETHSASNCTDYQARRLNIRYKDKNNKLSFVHTLNGTAFATGRIIIAILENYQQKDGSVNIPQALQKYTNFKIIK